MHDPSEIAQRLCEQVVTVEKMAFTLKLLFPQADSFIQSEAHCVCEWMKDAIEVLSAHHPADRAGDST
jgi:hypothetical protein